MLLQEKGKLLGANAVAYLNVDVAVSGAVHISTYSVCVLSMAIYGYG